MSRSTLTKAGSCLVDQQQGTTQGDPAGTDQITDQKRPTCG